MIRKSLYALAVATGAMAFASQAHAMTTFDFVALETIIFPGAGTEGVLVPGDFPINATTYPGAVSGGAASITSMPASGNAFSTAYLDGPSGGRPGSLGVCSTFGGACAGINDDNLGPVMGGVGGASESVTINFAGPTELVNLVPRDSNHYLSSSGSSIFTAGDTFSVTVNAATTSFSFSDLVDLSSLGVGTSFTFNYVPSPSPDDGSSAFYLDTLAVTAVPIPAALPLFATALAGFGVFGWRKRKAGTA